MNNENKNDQSKNQGTDQSKQATAPSKDQGETGTEKREAATGTDKK